MPIILAAASLPLQVTVMAVMVIALAVRNKMIEWDYRLWFLASNGPADHTERCLLLEAKQKTSALSEYFAF
jgi:hypothetical protein